MEYKKQVVVTGCKGGIGQAIVKRLQVNDFEVIGLDCIEHCDQVDYYYQVDLASYDALSTVLNEIKAVTNSYLYGLVNNAGLYLALDFVNLSVTDYERVMAVNVRAPLFLAKWFASQLEPRQGRGVIINIASISGEYGSLDVAYGVSKGAIINLTKSLMAVLAPRIRVNTVSPGVIETPMSKIIPAERLNNYKQRTANGYLGNPNDVAAAVEFLLRADNEFINGANLGVDGGFH